MLKPRHPRGTPRAPLGSLLIVAALALGACGSDDDDDMDPATGTDAAGDMDATGGAGETSMPAPGVDPNAPPDLTPVAYDFPLTVEEEIPEPTGVPDGAGGQASLVFDPATRGITGTVTTSGLSGPPTMAHIHEQPAGEMTGPPIVTLLEDGSGEGYVVPDATILTEEQAESLETGLLYVNVHTELNPPGEIRGQIVERDPEEEDGS